MNEYICNILSQEESPIESSLVKSSLKMISQERELIPLNTDLTAANNIHVNIYEGK